MSSDPAVLFNEAIALHRAGQPLQAEPLYRQVLQQTPQNIIVWRYLAAALAQAGNLSQAINTLKDGLATVGADADLYQDLGSLFISQGLADQAIAAFTAALKENPKSTDIILNLARAYIQFKQHTDAQETLKSLIKTHPNLALAHFEMGRLHMLNDDHSLARNAFLEAVKYDPRLAEAHAMLGNAFLALNDGTGASAAYRAALNLRPNLPGGHYNLALAEIVCRRPGQAVDVLKQALTFTPQSAEVYSLLSQAHLENDDFDKAIVAGETALTINPSFIPAMINLGNALRDQGEHHKAISFYQRAMSKEPKNLGLLINLGNAYSSLGDIAAAEDYYREALVLDPNHFNARWQLGLLLLMKGQFNHGWDLYESRWHHPEFYSLRRDHLAPAWQGQDLQGRTLLLWTEQGLGDSIQFIRLAQQARKLCGKIVLQCQPSIKWLFKTAPSIDEVIGTDDPRPLADAQAPLMSLPALLKIDPANLPQSIPYIYPNEDRITYWRQRLENLPRPLIGVSWQGSLRNRSDRHRSIPLQYFSPLAETAGTLISLQKIFGLDQISTCGFADRLMQFDDMDKGDKAFFDTAAIMHNLDVIVTSDTAIAHLSGALGRPTWVALQAVPDWRWMLERPDSPWYPTMRLFRQSVPGDWANVMRMIAQELRQFL